MSNWRSYDHIAETYEEATAPLVSQPARDLVALAGVGPAMRVLDIGSGTGVAAEAAREASGGEAMIVGMDSSPPMLAIAHRVRPGLPLVAAEAIDLPFRDGSFDVAIGNFVLSHFKKYETALFDIIRVVKPGGKLAFSSWALDHEDEFQRTWRELVEKSVGREMLRTALRDAVPWEEHFADPRRLEQALRDASLRPVHVERRDYRFQLRTEDYVRGREAHAAGRFVRSMLGDALWERFRESARELFLERFGEQIGDFRRVNLAVASKP